MNNTFQQNDDDYIVACPTQHVVTALTNAMTGDATYNAHLWYGQVSSASPLLSFAVFPGIGVYIAFNLEDNIRVYVDSDDYSEFFTIVWGQDYVRIPRAWIMALPVAHRIIQRFSETGTIDNDPKWRDYNSLDWDVRNDNEA